SRRRGGEFTITDVQADALTVRFSNLVTLDGDRRLVAGECTCPWHFQNKLRKGPCPHLLALRLAFERRLGTEAPAGPAGTTAPAAKASSGSASRGGSVVDRLLDASWARSRAPGAGAPARPPARRRPGPIATDREDADGDDDDDRDRDVDESDVRAPVSIAKLGEAHRFVALLRERGLVELDDHHPTFVTQVAQVLRFKGDVGTRAQTLFTVLERNPEVQEFYVLEVEDLIGLLEEWG
ncbi:MAG: SWIM zinc finger family protein, partial [Myxococcota bacterium]